LTSNRPLSFEARSFWESGWQSGRELDLKVWIQTASSLAKNADFSYFVRKLRNEGFT